MDVLFTENKLAKLVYHVISEKAKVKKKGCTKIDIFGHIYLFF